jgi:hypothetical protein
MSSSFKEIRVITDKNENRTYVGQYFIKIIKSTDDIIIGIPVEDQYDRVRVNIINDQVKLYKSKNDENKVTIKELYEINDRAPHWLDDYFS